MSNLPLAFTVKIITWNDTNQNYDVTFHNFDTQEEAKKFWNDQRGDGKKCRFIHHRLFLRTNDIPDESVIKSRYPSIIYSEKKNDHSYVLFFKTDSDKKQAKPVDSDKLFRFRTSKKPTQVTTENQAQQSHKNQKSFNYRKPVHPTTQSTN